MVPKVFLQDFLLILGAPRPKNYDLVFLIVVRQDGAFDRLATKTMVRSFWLSCDYFPISVLFTNGATNGWLSGLWPTLTLKSDNFKKKILVNWQKLHWFAEISITTFGWHVCDSSYTSYRPLQTSRHHFLTICIFMMMSLPYTSVNCLWISTPLVFFAVKNCITAQSTHTDRHAMGSSMFVVQLSLFVRAGRPTKNPVLPQSQTEYFPNFHSIRTVRWRVEKNGKLPFGTNHVLYGLRPHINSMLEAFWNTCVSRGKIF